MLNTNIFRVVLVVFANYKTNRDGSFTKHAGSHVCLLKIGNIKKFGCFVLVNTLTDFCKNDQQQ